MVDLECVISVTHRKSWKTQRQIYVFYMDATSRSLAYKKQWHVKGVPTHIQE